MKRAWGHPTLTGALVIGCRPTVLATLLPLLWMSETWFLSAEEPTAAATGDRSGVVDVVTLDEPTLRESSGLAVSRRLQDHVWTHNDSGGQACLFAFDTSGRRTGQIRLTGRKAVDWEDMASFTDEGVPRLLVADCGDNQSNRQWIELHLMDEPDPRESTAAEKLQTLSVTYPDGPRDCEAVCVDAQRREIVLISKALLPASGVYVVSLPPRVGGQSGIASITAKRVATLPLPMVTAMDVDPVSGDIWIVSYFQAFRFPCLERDESVAQQLARLPEACELPRWRQIESVAVDAESDLWVTSEGAPTPLGRLPQHKKPAGRASLRPTSTE